MLPPEALAQLKQFLKLLEKTPQLLHSPELSFFKEFIESFGGVVPPPPSKQETGSQSKSEEKKPEPVDVSDSDDEDVESDVELDNTGVIENPDPEIPAGDVSADFEVSEENVEKANEKKREGIALLAEGNYEKAIEVLTEAIKLNPAMSLLHAKRGQCYLQLNKPNACIHDCTNALIINPDNAAAYKYRGRAHRLLGHWLDAARDLRSASALDFDEQVDEWLKEVTPNARKIEEHRLKYERKRAEREIKKKQKRLNKAREEHAKAAAAGKQSQSAPNFGSGAAPGGGKGDFSIPPEMMDIFKDPEIQKCFEDPEVFAAFTDLSSNPANLMKYMGNPKIMALINKLSSKFDKSGKGFPGAFPGGGFPGAGGFPGFGGGPGAGAPPSGPNVPDDIGLD